MCVMRWPGSVAHRQVPSTRFWAVRVQHPGAVWSARALCPVGVLRMRSTEPVGEDSRLRGPAMRLVDRDGERGVLDHLINAVRAGGSRVLVVRGEPGVGKSALLDYLAGHAATCRVVRATGVESEMELAFAGLHQLLTPVLDRVDRLPVPQREALRTAFGLSAGPVPDRFLVGLAVLGLVSEVAGERPLI